MKRTTFTSTLLAAVLCSLTFGFQPAAIADDTATTTYSIGDPTDIEQYYVELINRARANPAAEAQRLKNTTDASVIGAYTYFGVNLNLMVTQFASLNPAPPVSINPKLTAAARVHSQDMLANDYQDHMGIDGSMPWDRATTQGYDWTIFGENVYSSASSAFFGHAGFEVDWGGSVGGMQSPAGHRLNIHNADYREIGVGVALGTNGSVGPQLVTQDFSASQPVTPFITGVVYYDFNSNGFYDQGEGLGGVAVTVSGATSNAVTANSGGYSVPVSGNGTYTVTFSAPGMVTQQNTVTIADGNNVKVDYVPAYVAPVVTGTDSLTTGQVGTFNFSTVGGATGYEYQQSGLAAFTVVEGAESGLGTATASISAGYTVIETDTVKNGTHAFHLAHPQATLQSLQFGHTVRVAANSALTFWSRLGWASTGQVAAAQVSKDGGTTWQDVWAVAGANSAGQTAFSLQTVSLAAFAGKDVLIRFIYRFNSGLYYPQVTAGVGFYFDDVAVTNAQELTGSSITAAGNGSFQFSSQASATYSLSVRAILPGRILPWGPAKTVTVQSPLPTANLAVVATPANGGTVNGGGAYVVNSSQQITATPNSGWTFTSWNDGNKVATRSVTVPAKGATYTATFTQIPVLAQLSAPANGSVFSSGTATFSWGGGIGMTAYFLRVGSTLTGTDLFNKQLTLATTSQAVKVPVDGRPIYVTLYSMIQGKWQSVSYTYTALTAQSQMLTVNDIEMTTGNIATQQATFAWTSGIGVTKNTLAIGSKLNGTDVFNATVVNGAQTVTLPTDGRTIYLKLSSLVNNVWIAKSYTYTSPTIAPYPAILSKVTTGANILPADGGTLTSGAAVFTWLAGNRTSGYYLSVGSKVGGTDIYNASQGTALSRAVTVPVDGRTLYVTLSSLINGVWQKNYYVYTAFTAQAQILTLNGVPMTSVLPAGTLVFTWSKGTGVSPIAGGSYYLKVGKTPNSQDYYVGHLAGTSGTVTNLPQDGRTVYVTLLTYINGKWLQQVYTCTAGAAAL